MVGNKGLEKEGDEKERGNDIQERGNKAGGERRSKSREGRVGLLNTKAYLDRRLLHLGQREKVCSQQSVKINRSLEFLK